MLFPSVSSPKARFRSKDPPPLFAGSSFCCGGLATRFDARTISGSTSCCWLPLAPLSPPQAEMPWKQAWSGLLQRFCTHGRQFAAASALVLPQNLPDDDSTSCCRADGSEAAAPSSSAAAVLADPPLFSSSSKAGSLQTFAAEGQSQMPAPPPTSPVYVRLPGQLCQPPIVPPWQ